MVACGGLVIGLAVVGGLVASARLSPPGDPAVSLPVPVLASGHSAEAEGNDEAIEFIGPLFFQASGPLDALGGEDQAWSVGATWTPVFLPQWLRRWISTKR